MACAGVRVSRDFILKAVKLFFVETQHTTREEVLHPGIPRAAKLLSFASATGPGKGPLNAQNESIQNTWCVLALQQHASQGLTQPADLAHVASIFILLAKMRSSSVSDCISSSTSNICLTMQNAERFRHILQIAIPLPHRVPHPILGPPLDRSDEVAMEYNAQDHLHWRPSLHRVFDVERLQTHA